MKTSRLLVSLCAVALGFSALAGDRLTLRTVAAAPNRTDGTIQSVTLTFGGPASGANKLYLVCGTVDQGVTLEGWDSVTPLADIAADEESRTVPVPDGWGTTVTVMRFLVQRPLPGGSAVTYLSSAGATSGNGPYIDTEFIPDQNSRADFTFRQFTSFSSGYQYATPFGVRTVSTNQFFVGASYKTGTTGAQDYWMRRYGLAGIDSGSVYPRVAGWHSVSMNKNKYRIDSESHDMNVYPNKGTQTFTADGPAYVFRVNRADGATNADANSPMELYTLDLYDNGTLKRAFIPAVKEDGTPALYDPITEKFYENKSSSTVPFTVGVKEYASSMPIYETVLPDGVKPLAYIESSGAQHVLTDYTPAEKTRIEAVYSVVTYPENGRAYIFGEYGSGSNIGRTQFAHGTPAFCGYGNSYGNGTKETVGSAYIDLGKDTGIHHVLLDTGTYTVDGRIAWKVGSWSNGTPAKLALFACDGNGTISAPSSIRLYGCRISEDGMLKANYVPARKNGVAGLYETVGGRFVASATATAFIEPPAADRPRLGVSSLTGTYAEGLTSTLHVSGGETASATVTCYFGTDAQAMEEVRNWTHQTAEADYTYVKSEGLAYGTTYYSAFKVAFEGDEGPVELWSPTNSVAISGTDVWNINKVGAWSDASNWSLGIVPMSLLPAAFDLNASVTAGDEALSAKSLSVRCNRSVALTMTDKTTIDIAGSLTVGGNTVSGNYASSLYLTNGCLNVGGSVSIPYSGTRGNWCTLELSNTRIFAQDALNLLSNNDSGFDNYVKLSRGSVLSVNNLRVNYRGTLALNASVVTNAGEMLVAYNAKDGTLKLENGSYFKQKYNATVGIGGKGAATVSVTDGSTFDAAGCTFGIGNNGDSGSSASTVTVSNGTFKAAAIVMPKGQTYTGTQSLVLKKDALVSLTGGLTVGKYGRTGGSSTVSVSDATLEVGGTLQVGADARANRLNLSGTGAKVTAESMSYARQSSSTITVPATGFTNTLVSVAGDITFPTEFDTPIKIDATACKSGAWQTLFKAGGEIKNLTDDTFAAMVTVTGTYKGRESELKLVKDESGKVKELKFRVKNGGLMLLVK